ncbi:unnamed protein product [Spirodela intermedia]|uniref:Uncharacterized protein n=1 Tax=Spirodela intermedia TaxID=51605 RepID=A0A7I8JNV4_SPIIN|nr:unnamed protein product [Spirodela intermedia]CAA6671836.1 unnamed protein product [Spirodela intermedia]
MDPDQTFLRSILGCRMALEYMHLGIAVALFGCACVMHITSSEPGCSGELSQIDISGCQLVQIKQNFISSWIVSSSRRKSIFKSWKSEKDFKDPQEITRIPQEISIKAAIIYAFSKWQVHISYFWKILKQLSIFARRLWNAVGWNVIRDIPRLFQMLHLQQIKLFLVQWLERGSKASETTYLYTLEKGYFLLPEGAKALHNIKTVNISISAQNSCFGNRWQQHLINSFVGYDTILMNSLLSFPGKGYLYSSQTQEFYYLGYGLEPLDGSSRFGDYFLTKGSVLIMSLFVFFTTTMSVSFTLRETQSRMLKFTATTSCQAQSPNFPVDFVHVIESLVFVPIMIGILFFLFEFYDDQMLAFLVLALVWLCELFTMISVRTPISMQFFPRFFLLYFLVFHIYFFSYSYGFSYLALFTTAAFMQHLILYFWNHYEVPALHRFMSSRSHLQQQAGVQITSSTIVTSTLHIARVNMGNQGILGTDPGIDPGPQMGLNPLEPDPDESTETSVLEPRPASGPNPISSPLQFPELNMQQAAAASNTGPLNPFGSMLLSILGGASSEGLVSFFSLFRDIRDPHQIYAEQQHHGDEPAM